MTSRSTSRSSDRRLPRARPAAHPCASRPVGHQVEATAVARGIHPDYASQLPINTSPAAVVRLADPANHPSNQVYTLRAVRFRCWMLLSQGIENIQRPREVLETLVENLLYLPNPDPVPPAAGPPDFYPLRHQEDVPDATAAFPGPPAVSPSGTSTTRRVIRAQPGRVLRGERGSAGRDGVRDAHQVEPDQVGVALDDGVAVGPNGVAGAVENVRRF